MKKWFNTKYGLAPYKELLIIVFSFKGIKKEDIAYKQYKLLLDDNVIQAHLEFENKEGIVLVSLKTNIEEILKGEEINFTIKSKKIISYEKVLKANNMFS